MLFIRLGDATDVINTLPAVCAFKDDRPEASIFYATSQGATADIAASCSAVEQVVIIPDRIETEELPDKSASADAAGIGKNVLSFLKQSAQKVATSAQMASEIHGRLRSLKLDVAVDLHVTIGSALIARNCGAGLVFGFHEENAADGKAAMAYANTPYVPPKRNDHEKFGILVSQSMGTAMAPYPRWGLPTSETPAETVQLIPCGPLKTAYWIELVQRLGRNKIGFSLVVCDLSDPNATGKLESEVTAAGGSVRRIKKRLCDELVQDGGVAITDGAGAYLSLGLRLPTVAIGEKRSAPLLGYEGASWHSYPDAVHPPEADELVGQALKIRDEMRNQPSPAAAQETDTGLDGHEPEPAKSRKGPLVFNLDGNSE